MFSEEFQLRDMMPEDVQAIMKIEKAAYPHPWTPGNFLDCLKSNYHACVLERVGFICGYAVMSIGAGEAHVLNICIDPQLQGQGLGRALLHALEQRARAEKADMMLLEVRTSNTVAINLYQSMGFNELGCRKNYYPSHNGREDAIVMARQLV